MPLEFLLLQIPPQTKQHPPGYNAIRISTVVDRLPELWHVCGYNAIRISTVVDINPPASPPSGYNAIRISTVVDEQGAVHAERWAIMPLEFLLLQMLMKSVYAPIGYNAIRISTVVDLGTQHFYVEWL